MPNQVDFLQYGYSTAFRRSRPRALSAMSSLQPITFLYRELEPLEPLEPLEVALGGIEVLLKLKVTSPDLPFVPLDCSDPL